MSLVVHPRAVMVVLATLGVCAVLASLAITVGLVLMSVEARSSPLPLVSPENSIIATAVSTVVHPARLTATPVPAQSLSAISPPQERTLFLTAPDPSEAFLPSDPPPPPLTIPGPLVDPLLSPLRGPVTVPLEIRIPALDIRAPVLGVGLSTENAMAAPRGSDHDDPLWRSVFWYRGGTIPGDNGTATFAGHYDDIFGRPAVFAFLDSMRVGDLIVVTDMRSDLDIPFVVTEMRSYSSEQAADPALLARVFGSAAATNTETTAAASHLSHLTLITCGGTWVNGSFDLRLVVYATRASYPF
jgi:sortase (surface protein transpeptidase)